MSIGQWRFGSASPATRASPLLLSFSNVMSSVIRPSVDGSRWVMSYSVRSFFTEAIQPRFGAGNNQAPGRGEHRWRFRATVLDRLNEWGAQARATPHTTMDMVGKKREKKVTGSGTRRSQSFFLGFFLFLLGNGLAGAGIRCSEPGRIGQ